MTQSGQLTEAFLNEIIRIRQKIDKIKADQIVSSVIVRAMAFSFLVTIGAFLIGKY